VGQSVALVDGHVVGDAVPRVQDNAWERKEGIEGQHSLDGDVHGRDVEGFEHDLGGRGREAAAPYLGHLLPVGLGVEGSLGEQGRVLLGGHAQLVVEGVVPDLRQAKENWDLTPNQSWSWHPFPISGASHLLHVVPVGDDAMLNGVLEREDTSLALRLVAHVAVLLPHANHDTLTP
ncbi:hypothetical protein N310_13621, partial [Acanthisitta chloris]